MKIVIVEDEAPIRNGMANILAKIDPSYEVVGKARDGREGVEIIRDTKPDLAILDIRMPDMDGLTMLKTLRDEGNDCKAVVLTAFSDFNYAKTAIGLGIENYLLKPIKLPELEKTLELIKERVKREKREKSCRTLDKILASALVGQLEMDDYLSGQLWEEYNFSTQKPMGALAVWLGESYGVYESEVCRSLKPIGESSGLFRNCIVRQAQQKCVLNVLYCIKDREETADYLRRIITPMVTGQTKGQAVTGLHYCESLDGFAKMVRELYQALDYNLTRRQKSMMYYEELAQKEWETFSYPLDMESRMKQAVAGGNEEEIGRCLRSFGRFCREGDYHPAAIKEACVKYFHTIYLTAKECGRIREQDVQVSTLLKELTEAVTWERVEETLMRCAGSIAGDRKDVDGESILIRRARGLIQEYYSQGITLEELAGKLGVSEEYLSFRMKKETGMTFTETMKRYRIERIKELLVSTSLKLNQIASKAGYSDPKYMSRVFKEETGMLPLEYRKIYS